MDSTGRDILGDKSRKTKVQEISMHESAKKFVDSNTERLLNEVNGNLGKRSAIVDDFDMLASFPANVKQRLYQNKAVPMETERSLHNSSPEDISTESDEATRDLIHMIEGGNAPTSRTSHDHNVGNVESLASKENTVNGAENSTQGPSCDLSDKCRCSFCLKAAHMWMDLVVQDTRGRLNEMQKNKKRVDDQIAKLSQNLSKISVPTNPEADVMQNARSLFIHTQDVVDRDIAKTKSDLEERSKQMEILKRELELSSSNVPPYG